MSGSDSHSQGRKKKLLEGADGQATENGATIEEFVTRHSGGAFVLEGAAKIEAEDRAARLPAHMLRARCCRGAPVARACPKRVTMAVASRQSPVRQARPRRRGRQRRPGDRRHRASPGGRDRQPRSAGFPASRSWGGVSRSAGSLLPLRATRALRQSRS
jgi:hypothetical protein